MVEYKTERGCIECKTTHPAVLVFHHRNPSEKNFSLAEGVDRSFKLVKKEVTKCDVMCCNCHAILHYEETL